MMTSSVVLKRLYLPLLFLPYYNPYIIYYTMVEPPYGDGGVTGLNFKLAPYYLYALFQEVPGPCVVLSGAVVLLVRLPSALGKSPRYKKKVKYFVI